MATLKGYIAEIDANNIKGGLYSVENYYDIFKFNAATRFKDGMLCYVSKEDKYYLYNQRAHRWLEVNINRVKFPDSSINIGDEWYDIIRTDNYDNLLLLLILIKYSTDWQATQDANMRNFPEIYYDKDKEYREWINLCKKAAWEYIYTIPYNFDNLEGKNDNLFDYGILKTKLLEINDDINFLKVASLVVNTDILITANDSNFESDNGDVYIEYLHLETLKLTCTITTTRNGEKTTMDYIYIKPSWMDSPLYEGSCEETIFSKEIILDSPELKDYEIEIIIKDNEKSNPYHVKKKISFTSPSFYGCCFRSDMNKNSSEELSVYNVAKLINKLCYQNLLNIDEKYELTVKSQFLYEVGLKTSDEIFSFIENIINPCFEVTVELTIEESISLLRVQNLYDILSEKIYNLLVLKNIEYNKELGFNNIDNIFSILTGAENGVKHYAKLTKIAINNIADGQFLWICIPTNKRPEVTADSMPFPLADDVSVVETLFGTYYCFRSIGKLGLEQGRIELEIVY